MGQSLRNTTSLIRYSSSWKPILGIVAISSHSGTTKHLRETDGLLPCAFQTMFDVRRVDGEIYLDATLTQRSNDMLVAHHINAMQYVALQMMIAKHFGWKVGKFSILSTTFISMIISLNKQRNCSVVSRQTANHAWF